MHDETLAIHGGYTPDSTRAVAVPIYQTVAHDFIDADHAGGIMDLETPGYPLQPPQQSHGRRARAADHRARGRRRRDGGQLRRGRGQHVGPQPGRRRRQLRVGPAALRSHVHVLRARASPARSRGPLRRGRQSRGDRGADRRAHQGGLLRDRRQPGRQRHRPGRRRRRRARPRRAR